MSALARRAVSTAVTPAPGRVPAGVPLAMVRREVVGDVAHVTNVIKTHRAAGTLVTQSRARQLAGGRAYVVLTVLEPITQPRTRTGLWMALGGVGVAVVGGIVVVIVTAVAWVMAHVAFILGGLVVLLGVLGRLVGRPAINIVQQVVIK